jgi:REP element-mobilizing transposase RayT
MDTLASLNHSVWDCKYHVVFIPKCRRRTLYGELRRHLGDVVRQLALQKESRIEEGHLLPDHVHMVIAIAPKYAVAQAVDTSRGGVRSIWRGCMGNGSAISWGNISGRVATSYRLWAGTNESSGNIFGSRNRRTRAWTSSGCEMSAATVTVALGRAGRVSDPP